MVVYDCSHILRTAITQPYIASIEKLSVTMMCWEMSLNQRIKLSPDVVADCLIKGRVKPDDVTFAVLPWLIAGLLEF